MEPAPALPASRRIFTIPNVLSLLRLASVPVFLWLWLTERRDEAVILYAVGAWSDFFDGYIARRTNSVTELGKLLDPLADRVFIVALALALVAAGTLPVWLMVVIVARDGLVLALFPVLERKGIKRMEVNRTGKTATASLLTGLTLLAISETSVGAGRDWVATLGMSFTVLGAALYWAAAVMYAREAVRRLQALDGRQAS